MEESFTTKALVLSRRPYKEVDSRVVVYTLDHGKMELVARGSQRLTSKLAAHIEPLNLVDLMVIVGRKRSYAGSAISQDSFADIKGDLEKVMIVGQALNLFNRLVKEAEVDERLFALLLDFLGVFRKNQGSSEFLYSAFVLKLLAELGYAPELYNCNYCKSPITPQKNYFSLLKGGLVCENCWGKLAENDKNHILTISNECVKVMRFILGNDFKEINRLQVDQKNEQEYQKLIELIVKFHN
jgi:DNA repair protein RecO (recombination protein O)